MFPAPGIIFGPLLLPGSFQINGVSSANLSLSDTRRLIEKSEGELTLLVLRDSGQFLVNIPPAVSDSDSSLMEGEGPRPLLLEAHLGVKPT